MELPEVPECPVCMQPYDGEATIPRVLACGHSACEVCLKQLPNPFPYAVRCPACTQLVKYPNPQGPSALPKNIDLLRISSLLQKPNSEVPQKPKEPKQELVFKNEQFMPNLWSQESYSEWKDWIFPNDTVSVEPGAGGDGVCSVMCGRIVNSTESFGLPARCLLKVNQRVSLVRVGSCLCENEDSGFRYSYFAKIMRVLYEMTETERGELGLILRATLKQGRMSKIYGLWYNSDDRCLYVVCERCSMCLLKKWDGFNDCVNGGEKQVNIRIEDDTAGFAMLAMEICEAVYFLHLEGLSSGCLAPSCFSIDDFGHIYIDFSNMLTTGREVRKIVAEAVPGKQKIDEEKIEKSLKYNALAFTAPEILWELLQKHGIDTGSVSSKYAEGHGSDVWSSACTLLWLLIGLPFTEEIHNYLFSFISFASDGTGSDYGGLYMGWMDRVRSLLETRLGSEFVEFKETVCNCLNLDQDCRPFINDLWKCINKLMIKSEIFTVVSLERLITRVSTSHCLVLGGLCQLVKETNRGSERQKTEGLQEKDGNGCTDDNQAKAFWINRDVVEGVSEDHVRCTDLKGHLDCISALAAGGGFLFSSSYDKTVNVWSLQDFALVHSFKGHEHKVMAVTFVDGEHPMCISGDNGGGICFWGVCIPFGQEPLSKLYEQKDWRYSGIHALAVSGNGYLYSGSGDRSIKAWLMKDYTLSCTMTGHKSVVSTLEVCSVVLYSGSWDGTVRLWCLSDHSPLAILGEDTPGKMTSVLSLAVDCHVLAVAYENGCIKIWSNDVLLKSAQAHDGAAFALSMNRKWLFTGGWDKIINVQKLSENEAEVDVIPMGSITCYSVVTALLYSQGMLFVGQADRVIKVYSCGL